MQAFCLFKLGLSPIVSLGASVTLRIDPRPYLWAMYHSLSMRERKQAIKRESPCSAIALMGCGSYVMQSRKCHANSFAVCSILFSSYSINSLFVLPASVMPTYRFMVCSHGKYHANSYVHCLFCICSLYVLTQDSCQLCSMYVPYDVHGLFFVRMA